MAEGGGSGHARLQGLQQCGLHPTAKVAPALPHTCPAKGALGGGADFAVVPAREKGARGRGGTFLPGLRLDFHKATPTLWPQILPGGSWSCPPPFSPPASGPL